MIGYVLDGDVARAMVNVETNIQSQHAALRMRPPGAFLPSTVLENEKRVRETHHDRNHEKSCLFCIHHLFVAA
jgi:hypothetical protein